MAEKPAPQQTNTTAATQVQTSPISSIIKTIRSWTGTGQIRITK